MALITRKREVWVTCFFGLMFGLAGVAFLLLRSVISPRPEIDFRFFWLAGEIWELGGDPYSPLFRQAGSTLLPDGNVVLYWFYPPQWWAICRLLAMSDLAQAVMLWRLASSAMILAGTAMLVASLVDRSNQLRWALVGIACGLAAVIEPTANMLAFGQSSGLVFLSMALLTIGLLKQNASIVCAALVLATFKPQVGAGLLLAISMVPRYRASALVALAVAGLLALPQIIAFGPLVTIREFIDNLQQWSALPSNTPLTSSGPTNLLGRLGFSVHSVNYQLAAAFALLCYAGWCLRRGCERPLKPVFLLMATAVALIPLHIYDFTIIIIPLLLHMAIAKRPTWTAGLVVVLGFRPGYIEDMLQIPLYGGGVSRGLILLSLLSLLLLADAVRQCRASPEPQLLQSQ